MNGMVKYCANKLNGIIDLSRFSQALGVSENFIQISLEIFENINSIEILDVNKLKFIKVANWNEFENDTMFEVLKDEFEAIIAFKQKLLKCNIKEIEKIIMQIRENNC